MSLMRSERGSWWKRPKALIALVLWLDYSAGAAVWINEFMAASSERRLTFDAQGTPRIGSGIPWMQPAYSTVGWSNGLLPAGYGFSGLATDLGVQMRSKTPSAFFRKQFLVSDLQAAATNTLTLLIQYNDGYVAYLNGKEVARANCAASNQFIFASQPAFNVSTSSLLLSVSLGAATNVLIPGTNLLAIQAHNAEYPSTTSDPSRSTTHTPTAEFRLNAGLRLNGGGDLTNSVDLAPAGSGSGTWSYFVGIAEPSGGVFDPGLISRTFKPPEREEDDFDQPAAFVDWLELYNSGPDPVDLGGWSLTDERSEPTKWRFPTNVVIAANGYLLVLCDSRDGANKPAGNAAFLHTNFKLAESGEYLGLYDAAGNVADHLKDGYPVQDPFHSFARSPDGVGVFAYSSTATPGGSNLGPYFTGRTGPPQFQDAAAQDLPGGVYRTQPLSLYLRHENPLASIRFTLDSTEPTERNGILYTNRISLQQLLEKTGIVVRARAFCEGALPSDVVSHTYLLRQPSALTNVPTLCFTGDPARTFYAPQGLLSVVGGTFADNGSGIWLAGGDKSYHMPTGDGIPFERAIQLEFFPIGNAITNPGGLRIDCGLRVSASGWTRPRLHLTGVATTSPWTPYDSNQKPSFNLCFAGDYGNASLNYDLFPGYDINKFDSLRVRAGKNDNYNPFITDELVRRLWQDLGHAGARGRFCAIYVNGIYRGVYNLCERIREPFFQAHYRSEFQWDVNYIFNWVDGDSTVYTQLLSMLDRDQTLLANWSNVTNRLDVVNAADYFLLNIYGATWDWPGNNFAFARERSTGPDSRFRFVVWDAEGAFNAIGYTGKDASYNTITRDLVLPSGDVNYNLDLPRIFRRLVTSPEFRLLFADRVNRHFFNGGVLDDRDPDGAGPLKTIFRRRLDELIAEAGPLVKYNSGQALITSAFDNWISAGSGRRSYLLGTNSGRQFLRDSKLWPATEPPIFNRFGGAVAPGFNLTITSSVSTTGQTAKIYFTTNNVDPRLWGGGRHASAYLYAGPVPIADVVIIKARAQNDVTGEWSAITEATFAPAAVPASAENLIISEIMYHPPPPTTAEAASGYLEADDFEFVRLTNIGPMPVDLAGVRFSLGITFDFTAQTVRYLAPGASVLVVKDLSAFQQRYGANTSSPVAGQYSGNLSNGGERIQLLATNGVVIRDFSFADSPPWPSRADGDGPSLILQNPGSNPDPGMPANWIASAVPGGILAALPRAQSFSQWRTLFWSQQNATNETVSGLMADPDADGLNNLWEYAFGLDPSRKSETPSAVVSIGDGDGKLAVSLRAVPTAQDAIFVWEWSTDLNTWNSDPTCLELTQSQPQPDGSSWLTFTETGPASESRRFVRLRIKGPGF